MCNYRKHIIIFLIIYLTVLSGLCIGLGINYIKKLHTEKYVKEQFNTTNFTIVGYDTYLGSCYICELKQIIQQKSNYSNCWKVSGFYGYAHIIYTGWFNNSLMNFTGITHGNWCDTNKDVILNFIKNRYPLNSKFKAYYNISNPVEWRMDLPGYDSYLGNLFILTIFSVLISIFMVLHFTLFVIWYYRNKDEIIYELV